MTTMSLVVNKQTEHQTEHPLSSRSSSGSTVINSFIVILFILVAILPATVFNPAQIAIELILIVLLAVLLLQQRFSREEVLILVVFGASQLVSFILNDLNVFMLNAKLFALPILTFLYFRKNHFRSRLIEFAFVINLILAVFQIWTGAFPLPLPYLGPSFRDYTATRPLGLFLNFTFSAYFAAIYLIYLSQVKRLFFLDFVFLYFTGVKTGLVSYFFQRVARLKTVRLIVARNRLTLCLTIIAALSFVYFGADFILGLGEAHRLEFRYWSLLIIYQQLLDPTAYQALLTPYPSDASVLNAYRGGFGNEIALLSMYVQGGAALTTTYLLLLTGYLTSFAVFFWISLLHNGYILSPLIIYMMVTYQASMRRTTEVDPIVRTAMRPK